MWTQMCRRTTWAVTGGGSRLDTMFPMYIFNCGGVRSGPTWVDRQLELRPWVAALVPEVDPDVSTDILSRNHGWVQIGHRVPYVYSQLPWCPIWTQM
eukprot:g18655.t1